MNYFEYFPLIEYNNYTVRDITARVKLSDQTLDNAFVFYPYTVPEGERADTLAYKYYNNSSYAWLIWFSNQTIDPYYQFAQSNDDFHRTIKSKYGSIQRAQKVIVQFETNEDDDFSSISVVQYQALPSSLRKYWTPEFDVQDNIFGYARSKINLKASTNQIIQITTTTPPVLIEGEIIEVDSSTYATILSVSDKTIIAHHVIGQLQAGQTITGNVSKGTGTIETITVINQTIPVAEYTYWRAVSAYSYHEQIALDKSTIKLLSSSLRTNAQRQLYQLLNYK
jgi:hypothetical protein